MPLSAGTLLGPYEILEQLGAGGMGEVYKARDTRVNRIVAVKVSKDTFSERFAREAEAIAALNHPNICTLHDVGPNYLVMEFIDGKPLSGPLPLDEALRLAVQVADALDHAHRAGVIHRDLKPANVLVNKNGVKVLDFGLAKLTAKPRDSDSADLNTVTMGLTQQGTILGTLQYMSPEQVEGKEADARSDIFAFGAVLFEILTGKKAFEGKSAATILASVIKDEPSAPPELIGPIEPVLRRCLAKDPEDRIQTARDLKWALAHIGSPASSPDLPAPAASRPAVWKNVWAWATAAALAVALAAVAWAWWRLPAPEAQALRFIIEPPPGTTFTNVNFATALSPDGRLLVFSALKQGAPGPSLWLRPMDSLAARELPGTQGGNGMFWSPDGKSIGFFADGKLKRVDALGGAPQTLCDVTNFEGGTWFQDETSSGTILFSSGGAIQRIPAAGGPVTPVTMRDASKQEAHRWPQFLPGGRNFLFTVVSSDQNTEGIYAATLNQPAQKRRLVAASAKASFAPPYAGRLGYLLWMREQTLVAQRFDPGSMNLEGDPAPVAEEVRINAGRRAAFWISDNGLLAYRAGESGVGLHLGWVGRDGKQLEDLVTLAPGRYGGIRLSPDGQRVALDQTVSDNQDVWLYELGRKVMTRFTFNPGADTIPVWSPDGRQVAYAVERNGPGQIFRKDAGGAGQEEPLTEGPNPKIPLDWSRDGRYLLYAEQHPQNRNDIWVLPLADKPADRKPVQFLGTPFNELYAQFSPDGRWIAYTSDETGRTEIYIQAFPPAGSKWQVSSSGASEPRWRNDGRELFYRSNGRIMAVGIRTGPRGAEMETPRGLFPDPRFNGPLYLYDVSPDGQRFLMLQLPGATDDGANVLIVVSNWQAGLK